MLSTLALGILGSRVADDPRRVSDWVLVGSAALFLYLGDVLSDCEKTARASVTLPRITAKVRADAFRAYAPRAAVPASALALLGLVLGLAAHLLT